jgi:hypothetical protein
MSNNAAALNSAMELLGTYFGAVSRADFMYKALADSTPAAAEPTTDSNEQASTNQSLINVQGRAAQKILDTIDGGLYAEEILATCEPAAKEPKNLWDGIAANDAAILRASFTIIGGKEGSSDPIKFRPITQFSKAMGDEAKTVNQESVPTEATPGLASIQVNEPVLNFANRDSGAVQLFMNGIPTVEFSRCIPYVNMQLIQNGPSVDSDGKPLGISLFRFINGETVTGEDTIDRSLAEAQPLEAWPSPAPPAPPAPPTVPPTPAEPPEPAQFNTAGMEVFTQPQTMLPVDIAGNVPAYASYDEMGAMMQGGDAPTGLVFEGEPGTARAAPIIDVMRPFMTLTDIKINIKPTRGPMSMKTGVISLVLHDRSRLSEIAALVKPSSFGSTEIMLEWGWSHPDGQLPIGGSLPAPNNMENPYGTFLNALKTKEKFTCYNSKYSFESDGQVKISLNVVSKGGDNTASLDIGMTPEIQAKWLATEKIIESVTELRKKIWKDEGLRDIIGDQVVCSISPTNVNEMINGDDARELGRWIAKNKTGEGAIADLAKAYGKIKDGGAGVKKSISAVIAAKKTIAKNGQDPWTESQGADGTKNTTKISAAPEVGSSFCSFGKLAMLFMGMPLAASGRFDEVQLFFYPFNSQSSYMAGKTIANFQVTMVEFDLVMTELKKKYVQVNINQWFSTMASMVLMNMASKAYGFGKLFTRDEDGKAKTNAPRGKGASYISTEKDKVLATVYGPDADIKFKQPLVKMYSECVPHRSSGDPTKPGEVNTILRLHFVDAQATSYTSFGELLEAKRNNSVGALSSTAAKMNEADPSAAGWKKIKEKATTGPAANLLQKSKDGKYFFIKGGAPAIKYFVKSSMPHINYGSAASAVLKANIQTMSNSKNATIHMIRAQKTGESDQGTPGDQDRGLPARMMPMQLSMEIIGCPLINFMQQFFIDFGTGTSVDNIYAVTGIDHVISPGKFITKVKFAPLDAYGKYESLQSTVSKAFSATGEDGAGTT